MCRDAGRLALRKNGRCHADERVASSTEHAARLLRLLLTTSFGRARARFAETCAALDRHPQSESRSPDRAFRLLRPAFVSALLRPPLLLPALRPLRPNLSGSLGRHSLSLHARLSPARTHAPPTRTFISFFRPYLRRNSPYTLHLRQACSRLSGAAACASTKTPRDSLACGARCTPRHAHRPRVLGRRLARALSTRVARQHRAAAAGAFPARPYANCVDDVRNTAPRAHFLENASPRKHTSTAPFATLAGRVQRSDDDTCRRAKTPDAYCARDASPKAPTTSPTFCLLPTSSLALVRPGTGRPGPDRHSRAVCALPSRADTNYSDKFVITGRPRAEMHPQHAASLRRPPASARSTPGTGSTVRDDGDAVRRDRRRTRRTVPHAVAPPPHSNDASRAFVAVAPGSHEPPRIHPAHAGANGAHRIRVISARFHAQRPHIPPVVPRRSRAAAAAQLRTAQDARPSTCIGCVPSAHAHELH